MKILFKTEDQVRLMSPVPKERIEKERGALTDDQYLELITGALPDGTTDSIVLSEEEFLTIEDHRNLDIIDGELVETLVKIKTSGLDNIRSIRNAVLAKSDTLITSLTEIAEYASEEKREAAAVELVEAKQSRQLLRDVTDLIKSIDVSSDTVESRNEAKEIIQNARNTINELTGGFDA